MEVMGVTLSADTVAIVITVVGLLVISWAVFRIGWHRGYGKGHADGSVTYWEKMNNVPENSKLGLRRG